MFPSLTLEQSLISMDMKMTCIDALQGAFDRYLKTSDDPLRIAHLRGVSHLMRILGDSPYLWRMIIPDQVAEHLGITIAQVETERLENRLIALDFHTGNIWLYPQGQFTPGGQKLPGLEEFLTKLETADPFTKAQLLFDPHSLCNGETIAEYLLDGGDVHLILSQLEW